MISRQVILTLLFSAIAWLGMAQDNNESLPPFEIKKVYPSHSIDITDLESDINTLSDINRFYKDSWVRTYKMVTLSASVDGKVKKVQSSSDHIIPEQKELIKNADYGSTLEFMVEYLPENTLVENPVRTFDFSFTVNPFNRANFKNGSLAMQEYFTETVIEKIPSNSFTGLDLAAYTFTINTDGQIIDSKIHESSKQDQIDQLVIKAICDMPNWNPANYDGNNMAEEEFVLLIGNNQNCMINTLNINPKRYPTEE